MSFEEDDKPEETCKTFNSCYKVILDNDYSANNVDSANVSTDEEESESGSMMEKSDGHKYHFTNLYHDNPYLRVKRPIDQQSLLNLMRYISPRIDDGIYF